MKRNTYELWYLDERVAGAARKERIYDYITSFYKIEREHLSEPVRLVGGLDHKLAEMHFKKLYALTGNATAVQMVRAEDPFSITILRFRKKIDSELINKIQEIIAQPIPSIVPFYLQKKYSYAEAQEIARRLKLLGIDSEIYPTITFSVLLGIDSEIYPTITFSVLLRSLGVILVMAAVFLVGRQLIHLTLQREEATRSAMKKQAADAQERRYKLAAQENLRLLLNKAVASTSLAEQVNIIREIGDMAEPSSEATNYVMRYLHDQTRLKLRHYVPAGGVAFESETSPREEALRTLARIGGDSAVAVLSKELTALTASGHPSSSEIAQFSKVIKGISISMKPEVAQLLCEFSRSHPAWFNSQLGESPPLQSLIDKNCHK